jgi:hypothetical protein
MKTRVLILFTPVILAVVLLLVLASIHPAANGKLVVHDGGQFGIVVEQNEPWHLQSLDELSELVIRDVPVTLEADHILIEGIQNRRFKAITLDPSDHLEVSHDLPDLKTRALSFTAESSKSAGLRLTHRPFADQNGFYIDFAGAKGSDVQFAVSYEASTPEIKLTVKGSLIKNQIATEPENILSIPKNQALSIRLLCNSTGNGAHIRFGTEAGGFNFLSVAYKIPKERSELLLISKVEAQRMHVDSVLPISSTGIAQVFVDGIKTTELEHVNLMVKGDNVTIRNGIDGTRKGLNTEFNGTFSYLGLATNTPVRDSGNGDEVVTGWKPVLPSLLSEISTFYAILFAAIAYVIDKLVTIHNFLNVKKDGADIGSPHEPDESAGLA